MTSPDYSPQADIFNPDLFGYPVTIIGLGGGGSAILLALMKMGVMKIIGYDPDSVEEHNVPAQLLYSMQRLGQSKVQAAADYFNENTIDERQEFKGEQRLVTPDEPILFDGVVISAVDTMKARQEIWRLIYPHEDDQMKRPETYEAACENAVTVPLYFDCRMGANIVQVHIINLENPDAVEAYQTYLFDDEEAADLPYGARTFIASPLILAGYVAYQLAEFQRGRDPRQFGEINLETF